MTLNRSMGQKGGDRHFRPCRLLWFFNFWLVIVGYISKQRRIPGTRNFEGAILWKMVRSWLWLNFIKVSFIKKLQTFFTKYLIFINTFMTKVLIYRNQSIDLLCKSMGWFLYDRYLSVMDELISVLGSFRQLLVLILFRNCVVPIEVLHGCLVRFWKKKFRKFPREIMNDRILF